MRSLLTLLFVAITLNASAQYEYQYFDGADTLSYQSLFYHLSTDSGNIWQVGTPQKIIFDSAATVPNAMVTDTVNYYPQSNQSTFILDVPISGPWVYIDAIQWKQKLDYYDRHGGGLIDFRVKHSPIDTEWKSVFTSSLVYNFYGFDTSNVDTLFNGQIGFTATDSSWKDIWLCFSYATFESIDYDTLQLRFTSISDSVFHTVSLSTDSTDTIGHEGWLIDNFMNHQTYAHTVKSQELESRLAVYPTVTNGIVYIHNQPGSTDDDVQKIQVISLSGKLVWTQAYHHGINSVDLKSFANGSYIIKVSSDKASTSYRIVLDRH